MPLGKLGKIPGLGTDAARILIAAINGLVDAVNGLAAPERTTGLQRSGYVATENETVRMRGGNRLTLPRARPENMGAQIRVIVETAGDVSVVATGGTVNGATEHTLSLVGLYTFSHNGAGGWFSERGEMPTPGDGIDLVGTTISADVSDFAGTGLEDDGANNLRIAAAAAGAGLTGGAGSALEVGAGTGITVNANDVAVDQTFSPTWTGAHKFDSAVKLSKDENVTTVGTIIDLALGATTNRIRMGGGAGDRLLVSMDPGSDADGRVVIIQNIDGTATDDIEVQHDDGATGTATMRFICADQANARIGSRGMGIAVYDDTSNRWYLTVVSREATRLIAVHEATAADASYSVTVPAGATWFKAFFKGGGSGGGGADANAATEFCAGGGGGEGCEGEVWLPVSSGAVTGAIGAGGTAGSNAGGNGGVGGGTTVIYNGSTYTANQGGVGIGAAAAGGITGAGGDARLGGTGGGGSRTAGSAIEIWSRFITGSSGSPGLMLGAAAAASGAAIGGNGAGRGGGRGGMVANAATTSSAGDNATERGCGGGGAASVGVVAGATGGTGSPGYVRFEFYSGPVPTFSAVA